MARDKRSPELPSADCALMTLPDFITHASSGRIDPPWHLGEYFEICQRMGDPREHLTMDQLIASCVHACISVPPQHGKTKLAQYTIAWLLFRFPHLRFGFGSYAKLYSTIRCAEIMQIYESAGGELMTDHARKEDWRTAGGGGVMAFSPDSIPTGHEFNHLVFDDFVRNARDLDTQEKIEHVHQVIDEMTQRLWPGAFILIIGTRWHPDDPVGHGLKRGYTEVNLPAVREVDGVECALWPEKKPMSWLDLKRLPGSVEWVGSEYAWLTQYQGRPVPPEGAVFGPPRWYETLPIDAYCAAIGFDFGYGPEGTSDFSVAVVLFRDCKGLYYVHEVLRVRATLQDMALEFKALMARYPYPVRYGCYMGANEKGILNLLFQDHVAIERMPARHNKFTRAQRCAGAWKVGRIMCSRGMAGASSFARECEFFTGNEKGHDDQVDALVSGFDLVELNAPVGWAGSGFTFGSAVM